jgi:CBS domain-containing protein/sporulation protein YlmC with PRC-barrel domain
MANISTFYFSRIVGRKIVNDFGKKVGIIKDLVVEFDDSYIRPKVVGVLLHSGKKQRVVDFTDFRVDKIHGQYVFNCNEFHDLNTASLEILMIGKNIQDRQLVDMDGRKLVRVNDVRLAVLSNGTYLVAADVGLQGFFRRLGVAKPLIRILKIFKATIPTHLILWEDVETVDTGHSGIRLSKDQSHLSTMHPSDLADIIEELDRNSQLAVFASLDQEKAADVLEELDPDVQKIVLESMSVDRAADLLEMMPTDEVADILDELGEDQAEALLKEMEVEASEEVRELMDYDDDEVGSIMTTDYIDFNENNSVEETINELRRLKPDPETMYYLYIVDEAEKLLATISLRDLIVAEPQTKLSEIMDKNVIFINDTDNIDSIAEIISKYSLFAVPVVDENETMVGVVEVNDVVHNLLKARKRRF